MVRAFYGYYNERSRVTNLEFVCFANILPGESPYSSLFLERTDMRENQYQQDLKKRIKERIPDCRIFKNDSMDVQGFPDLSIHRCGKVAYLEVKRSPREKKQPNQEYYIETLSKEGAFASFIFPENEKETLDAMERALGAKG